MPNRIEARSAKAALTNATGRLPLLRLFSTPLIDPEGFCQLTEACPLVWPNYCVEGIFWQFTTATVKLAKVLANVA